MTSICPRVSIDRPAARLGRSHDRHQPVQPRPTSSANSRAHRRRTLDAGDRVGADGVQEVVADDPAGTVRHPRSRGHRYPGAEGGARTAPLARAGKAAGGRHRRSRRAPGAIFKFFAGEALRPGGENIDSIRPGIEVEITREPSGVVAAITPWNFPLAIPAWKIAPALAFGNCVVFKPAELVPASPWTLVDIIQRAGLPPGVLNLVMGPGSRLGAALAASPDIDAISFTGSQDVGPSVAAAAVKTGARVQLEMGGKNPLIVLDDADLATAVSVAVNGAFFQAGQRCTASSRLIVTEGIHDRFVDAMIARMKTLVVDDALKPGTEIGPVVDRAAARQEPGVRRDRPEGRRAAGARRRASEARHRRLLHGPRDLHGLAPEMRINQDEIFGPVASVIRVRDYDEALAMANATPFGLSAGIVTTSLKHASHFKRQFRERPRDGEPADRGPGLSRTVRRSEEVELRAARAGQLREGVLHDRQDSVHLAVETHLRPAGRARCRPALRDAAAHGEATAGATFFWSQPAISRHLPR